MPSFPIGAVTVTTTLWAACRTGPQIFEGKPTRTAGAQRRGAEAARQHCLAAPLQTARVRAGLRHVDEQAATMPTKTTATCAPSMAPSSAP